ncbi:MAG TPA: response regulator [Terriglobia bacterium]|nr:response regulator [Terriglobia bacterium]
MEEKVLFVDDDDLVLACFQRMLSRHFNVDTAPGPWEGLHAISTKGPYRVVVSDMRMPRLNGIQFLTKARELAPDMVGIILSGNLDDFTMEFEALGRNEIFKVLPKPCPHDQLIDSIKEAIAYKHKQRKSNPHER